MCVILMSSIKRQIRGVYQALYPRGPLHGCTLDAKPKEAVAPPVDDQVGSHKQSKVGPEEMVALMVEHCNAVGPLYPSPAP